MSLFALAFFFERLEKIFFSSRLLSFAVLDYILLHVDLKDFWVRRLADSFGIRFYETSAKTGDNVYVRPDFSTPVVALMCRSVFEKWSADADSRFLWLLRRKRL